MPRPDADTGALTREVDLTSCDREPIHKLGRVQSFGALIAVSADWIVTHASDNVADFLGREAGALIGLPLAEAVEAEALHALRSKLQMLGHRDAVERAFGLRPARDAAPVDATLHLSGDVIVIEMERAGEAPRPDYGALVRPMIDRMSRAGDVETLCEQAARHLRALTGFDRVMVYRFADDDTGEVIAESRAPDMASFKGLRYPASDIPVQARALYKRNLLRLITDVADPGRPILPARDPEGRVLDLSMSAIRAVSPIHLEYLANMGVGASLSVSIVKRDRLWGLFACHHRTARLLSPEARAAAELFGQLFAFVLDQRLADVEREEQARARQLHDRLMARLAGGSSIAENFETIVEAIGEVVAHDGAVGWIGGEYLATGQAPTREEFLGLVRFLNTTAASRVYHTERLGAVFAPAADFVERAAGMLVLPVSRTPRDYIVLFRREIARSVTWAGDPTKPAELGPNGLRLTPRKSFEAWQEVVRGTSAPWTSLEVQAAEALRVTLLEVVLRMTDAAVRDRARAQERQELLIAELNHRVRNILGLIRSLIAQSRGEAETVAEFTEVVGGRIHALARAHDQITRESWNPASAHELVQTETAAYLGAKADRICLSGPDVALEPKAFTTLALVVHELTTNAAKYGALSDRHGAVDVRFAIEPDGALAIDWRERGGPPVRGVPNRRGFGTTIIERSVPFELQGTAEVRFEVGGLQARFVLPPAHVAAVVEAAAADDASPAAEDAPRAPLSGDVLVLEDNMIIALDAETCVAELGAERVHVASCVRDALAILDRVVPDFAILDVNLGAETSEAVARRLAEAGARFVFATGYGGTTAVTTTFPDAVVVQKPYDRATLESAIAIVS
ncbi:MAG: HWE histidine kinase domain-containing protein [Paracoccaceae bacterium]